MTLNHFILYNTSNRWARRLNIPPYQWTAIDVKTRLRFISYSYEKTFTNGLMFMLLLIYFVRSFGIEHKITLQTDNGEEFGGKSVDKWFIYPRGRRSIKPSWNDLIRAMIMISTSHR